MSRWFRSYGFADVDDDLVIGAYPLDAGDVAVLERIGITRVLNLTGDDEYEPTQREAVESAYAAAGIIEARLPLVDYGHLPVAILEQAVSEVREWLEEGRRTYLHCRAGWQRSAAVAAGVIATRNGLAIADALAQVQLRKPSANPLPHQRDELFEWWNERTGATRRPATGAP